MSKKMSLILSLISAAGALTVAWILQTHVITKPDELKVWLESYGWMALMIYAVIQTTTLVIAPLGGMTAQIAIMGLYGPAWGSVIVLFVSTPIYFINFWLAKKFGRRIVTKLLGSEAMATVDRYADHLGTWVLMLFRIQNGSYDFISYAAGLTHVSTRTYTMITLSFGIPAAILQYLIFRFSPNLVTAFFVIQGVTIGLLTFIMIWFYPKINNKEITGE